jgi:hypothetical protein
MGVTDRFTQDFLKIFSVCLSQGCIAGFLVTLMSEKQVLPKTARFCIRSSGLMTTL